MLMKRPTGWAYERPFGAVNCTERLLMVRGEVVENRRGAGGRRDRDRGRPRRRRGTRRGRERRGVGERRGIEVAAEFMVRRITITNTA